MRSNHSLPSTSQGDVHLWASQALLEDGWASGVQVCIGADGRIASVQTNCAAPPGVVNCGVLLPALANLHSHSFQRAFAGLTEARGEQTGDSFWTWRALMYRYLGLLAPGDIEAIAAFVFMESLLAGYASVGEFHYLHHQPGGTPYDNPAETSLRIAEAAATSGIGLTLLPVLYQQGGCDGRALNAGQQRFYNDTDRFARLCADAGAAVAGVAPDCVTGVAPHSLRAVAPRALKDIGGLAQNGPVHLHIAEQRAEVDEVLAHTGERPVQWLLNHVTVDSRWCLVHATWMDDAEVSGLAASGAVAGICPVTEANLGDGIFPAVLFCERGGRFGVGTDSNIRISLVEELRQLEYSQRLRDQSRAALASPDKSTGRMLFESAASGGAQALGRGAGRIAVGQLADLVALDDDAIALQGLHGNTILDSYLFAGDDRLVTDVWSAGRHVVQAGRHIRQQDITRRYRETIQRLRGRL